MAAHRKHGRGTDTSGTYSAWMSMRARCLQPGHHDHKNYGGRGITICPEWADFKTFLSDMGEQPKGLTLDRIDNAKGYEPGNCRWATMKENQRNKRTNRLVMHEGRSRPLVEWAEEAGISHGTLTKRLDAGWPVPRALTEPTRQYSRRAA